MTIPSTQTLLTALAIIIGTAVAAWLIGRVVRHMLSRDNVPLPNTSIFENIVRLGVWAVGLAWALDVVGVKVSAVIAALGIAGLAVSLGLQDTLSNFFSGLQIVLSQQLQPGERVRLSTGEEGVVRDVTWRNTTIVSGSEDLIVVPNSVLGRALLTNLSRPNSEHVVTVPFVVAYGTDVERLSQIAAEAGRAVAASDDGVGEANPVVRLKTFGDSGVECSLSVRIADASARARVVDELVRELYSRFAASGIRLGTSGQPLSVPGDELEDGAAPAVAAATE